MDWKGQKLAEDVMQYVIALFAVIAFGAGYLASSFVLMMKIFGCGALVASILVLIDWPWYNRDALKWIDPKTAAEAAKIQFKGAAVDVKPKKQKGSSKK